MANRTVKEATAVKGTNPQYLVEKIVRLRIYDARYWKEECFALTAELLVDRAVDLKFVGGVYGGNVKPTPFLCLILKMLQIQPEKAIVVEFIKNEDYKYVRALGAMYMRLTGGSLDCYKYLEPLYNDYRKMKYMDRSGKLVLLHMDEFIDQLLREERVCDIVLPRIQKREVMEETNEIEPRLSVLEENLEEKEHVSDKESDDEPTTSHREKSRSASPKRRRKSPSPPKERRHRSRSRSHSRERHRSKSPKEKKHHKLHKKDKKHRRDRD